MIANLFTDISTAHSDEQFVELLARPGVQIERIVSHGHASPPGFWYDQPQGEWVLILQGEAALRFEDEPAARVLKAGDFVDIAAHRRHRVDWTHAGAPTVWLAVYYSVRDA
ncbi:MAG TPA: cupin domain-containing protein [Burkholderiales bacterium]|nr:cupin domain-containing protein [Burkholderiales bacterium]